MSKTMKEILAESNTYRRINRKAKSNKFWLGNKHPTENLEQIIKDCNEMAAFPIDRTEITLLVDPVRPKRKRRKASVKLK